MATITTKTTKSTSITANIMVDDVQAKGFSATINTDNPNDLNMSNWIVNQEVYKANRPAINAEITKLEDQAYAEQERMLAEQGA